MTSDNAKKALDFDNCDDEDEEGEYDDEACEILDYMVGTRPLFREDMKFPETYNDILQVFHICTDDDPESRPDAKKLEDIFKEFNNACF